MQVRSVDVALGELKNKHEDDVKALIGRMERHAGDSTYMAHEANRMLLRWALRDLIAEAVARGWQLEDGEEDFLRFTSPDPDEGADVFVQDLMAADNGLANVAALLNNASPHNFPENWQPPVKRSLDGLLEGIREVRQHMFDFNLDVERKVGALDPSNDDTVEKVTGWAINQGWKVEHRPTNYVFAHNKFGEYNFGLGMSASFMRETLKSAALEGEPGTVKIFMPNAKR